LRNGPLITLKGRVDVHDRPAQKPQW